MIKQWFLTKYEIVIMLFSVSIISFAVLSFEITVTRIFSVSFSYHYTFLAVSMALFGLGLGGILAQIVFSKMSLKGIFAGLALVSLLFSLLISFFTIIIVNAPYASFVFSAVLMFFPFFVAGVFLAAIYKVFAMYGNTMYCVDLIGAAVGSLAVMIFLVHCGAINTVISIGAISSIVSCFWRLLLEERKLFS